MKTVYNAFGGELELKIYIPGLLIGSLPMEPTDALASVWTLWGFAQVEGADWTQQHLAGKIATALDVVNYLPLTYPSPYKHQLLWHWMRGDAHPLLESPQNAYWYSTDIRTTSYVFTAVFLPDRICESVAFYQNLIKTLIMGPHKDVEIYRAIHGISIVYLTGSIKIKVLTGNYDAGAMKAYLNKTFGEGVPLMRPTLFQGHLDVPKGSEYNAPFRPSNEDLEYSWKEHPGTKLEWVDYWAFMLKVPTTLVTGIPDTYTVIVNDLLSIVDSWRGFKGFDKDMAFGVQPHAKGWTNDNYKRKEEVRFSNRRRR